MKKAVIIGAGPAGVTAAYELLKKSDEYEVLILEERSAVSREQCVTTVTVWISAAIVSFPRMTV